MSEAVAIGLTSLLAEGFPVASVSQDGPFAELLATLKLPLETLPIEADPFAALLPDFEFRSPLDSHSLAAPLAPLAIPAPSPPQTAALTRAPAASAAPLAVAAPTVQAPEIGSPGLLPPDLSPVPLAALPPQDARVPVQLTQAPSPAVTLPPELLRAIAKAAAKPVTNTAVAPRITGEHSAGSNEELFESELAPARPIETKLPVSQAAAHASTHLAASPF